MSFIRGKIEGFRNRLKCWSLGIVYLTSKGFRIPRKLWINGAFRELLFNNPETNAFVYEFSQICIHDCYQLKLLKKELRQVDTVVDIGANQGIFLVTARKNFSRALLHAYEPNPNIYGNLSSNAGALGASAFLEAVTKEDGNVELNFGESDLHTTARPSSVGNSKGTALKRVIERAGGKIDILKMDCEGGEWELFEDIDSWRHIKSLTMEYHLWAKKEFSEKDVKEMLGRLGFEIISHDPLSEQFGLITAIRREESK